MYNFSGVYFRIWGVCAIIVLIGIICILITKLWLGFNFKKCAFGMFAVLFGLIMSLVYIKGVVCQDVCSYTGVFVQTTRNSRVAPPLPVTREYVFYNGEGKKQEFYLDAFSKKEVFPYDFKVGETYTVYFEKFSSVIVKVETEGDKGDGSVVSK